MTDLSYKTCCLAVFKDAFEKYKKSNEKKKKEEFKLIENVSKDRMIFDKILVNFDILNNMLKFCIISDKNNFTSFMQEVDPKNIDELITFKLNFPKSLENIIHLCYKYATSIDLIKEDLYDIINLENYEGLILLNKINPLLYYNIVEDTEMSEKIEFFEEDVIELSMLVKRLVKKMLKINITIAMSKS